MRWIAYPSDAKQRLGTVARDGMVVVLLLAAAWIGWQVHGRIDRTRAVTTAVQSAGNSVRDGFASAADAVSAAPVVGPQIADALTVAGEETGGTVVDLGVRGDTAIAGVATMAGWLTFAVPALVLLAWYLPMRLAQGRRLAAAQLVCRAPDDSDRARLLAMRAAFSLPADHLVRFTDDPIGDLVRGDHRRLVAALLADAGLAPNGGSATRPV